MLASKNLWPESPQSKSDGSEKKGLKRNVLVDENDIPMSPLVSAANQHGSLALEPLLTMPVVSSAEKSQCHLCPDSRYVGKEEVAQCNASSHIRPGGEEKKEIATYLELKLRRWFVELTHSWFNRFRKLIHREKTDCFYLGPDQLSVCHDYFLEGNAYLWIGYKYR